MLLKEILFSVVIGEAMKSDVGIHGECLKLIDGQIDDTIEQHGDRILEDARDFMQATTSFRQFVRRMAGKARERGDTSIGEPDYRESILETGIIFICRPPKPRKASER